MTAPRSELSRGCPWQLRDLLAKLFVLCSLFFNLAEPVLGEEEHSESLTTALSMLEDRELHTQSALRFSKVYSFVAGVDARELKDILSAVTGKSGLKNSDRVRSELQIAILQRLTNHDPIEALEYVEKRNDYESDLYLREIFESWANIDPSAALSHARKLDTWSRDIAMLGLLDARIEVELSDVFDVGLELDLNEEDIATVLSDWLNAQSVQDPKDMWKRLNKLSGNDNFSSIRSLRASLAIQWYQAEGISALEEIRALSAGRGSYGISFSLRRLLEHIALEDPGFALNYVLKLPSIDAGLAEELIRIWAEMHPKGALEATYTVRDDGRRLRHLLQGEVALVWAEKEPRYILQNLDVLPEPVRYGAARIGVGEIAKGSLQEAGEYALQIEDLKLRTIAVSWLLSIWSNHEPSTLLDWLLSDPVNKPIVAELRRGLVYCSLYTDPKGAFQIALGVPCTQWDRGSSDLLGDLPADLQYSLPPSDELVAEVMEKIGKSDSQLALDLLSVIRDEDTKFVAALHLGDALVFQGDITDALELGQQLPELVSDRYYFRLFADWSREDPISLLESIGGFPSPKHKSSAAAFLLRADRRQSTLEEAQVNSLQQYLSNADRNWVDWH